MGRERKRPPSELELLLWVCVLVDCRVRVGLWLQAQQERQSVRGLGFRPGTGSPCLSKPPGPQASDKGDHESQPGQMLLGADENQMYFLSSS